MKYYFMHFCGNNVVDLVHRILAKIFLLFVVIHYIFLEMHLVIIIMLSIIKY